MNTDFPIPAEPNPDAKRRSDEIRKSAELGQKRFQADAKLRERLREQKEATEAREQAGALERAKEQEQSKKKMKGFRSVLRDRAKEYEEFEKRKQTEKQWYEKQNEQVRTRRAKEKEYMASLNASSTEIIAERRRIEGLKAEEARLEQKIEFDHAEAVAEALRLERLATERIASEARQKAASLEEKARQELYTLEGWKRSQMTALDAEVHRLQASSTHLSPLDSAREMQRITLQLRTKKRSIDKDFLEKRSMIESTLQREKHALDREKTQALFQASLDARRTVTKADHLRDTRLEMARREYDQKFRDRSQGSKAPR